MKPALGVSPWLSLGGANCTDKRYLEVKGQLACGLHDTHARMYATVGALYLEYRDATRMIESPASSQPGSKGAVRGECVESHCCIVIVGNCSTKAKKGIITTLSSVQKSSDYWSFPSTQETQHMCKNTFILMYVCHCDCVFSIQRS